MLQSYIGKTCTVSTGVFGKVYNKYEIVEIKDNWVKLSKKDKEVIVNIEHIASIQLIK